MPSENAALRRWALLLASVAAFMVALDTLVVSTALSTIRLDLHASVAELEWTVNAYNLSFAVLLLTASAIGDRYGRRRMFAAGLALFVAGSAACALAPNVELLIAARAVQGVGAAFVMPLSLAIVSAAFPADRRGAALGILQGLTGLAVASGPVIGGAIADGLAWEWIFWLNVPIGLLAIPFVLARIEESYGEDTTLDIPGFVLATGAAFGVVWALVRGNSAGWGSAEVILSLVGGALLTFAFVGYELRTREPMLPPRLFRSRAFSAGNAASFFTVACLFGCVFFFAQFMQTGLGHTPLEAGLMLLPWTGTLFIVAPIAGALVERVGERPLLSAGLLLQAAGMGWIALIADPGMAYAAMIPPLVVAGTGVSMAFPAVQNAVISSVAPGQIGKAAGVNSMARELGGVFGIAILVAVFTGSGSYDSAASFVDGFVPAVSVAAGLSLLGCFAALALPARPRRTRPQQTGAVPALKEA